MVAQRVDQTARLLIADDDPGFRQTVVEILRPHFCTIDVESGQAAIQIVESAEVDVALFDMHMPLLTGLEAIRWMRENRSGIPCILMSADVTDELETEAFELETFSVLRKPPKRDQLLDTIQCALKL